MLFYHASNIEGLREILPLSESKNKEDKDKVAYFTTVRLCAPSYLRDMEVNHVTIGIGDDNEPECLEFFPDQLRIMYQGRSGYLYTCENNGINSVISTLYSMRLMIFLCQNSTLYVFLHRKGAWHAIPSVFLLDVYKMKMYCPHRY